jgi:hypothetical protein
MPPIIIAAGRTGARDPLALALAGRDGLLGGRSVSVYPRNATVYPRNATVYPRNATVYPLNAAVYPLNATVYLPGGRSISARGRKPPLRAVKCPARSYKRAIENRFTIWETHRARNRPWGRAAGPTRSLASFSDSPCHEAGDRAPGSAGGRRGRGSSGSRRWAGAWAPGHNWSTDLATTWSVGEFRAYL